MEQETKQQVFTTMVKANSSTYFFDVKEAKNGKRYLVISHSRFTKDRERERAFLTVFANDIVNFKHALDEAVDHIIE